MDDSDRILLLTSVVIDLANSVEALASKLCDFSATDKAQVAREDAERIRSAA